MSTLQNIDLSFRHIRELERTKHVHRLHPYLGKFIPQLVEVFLKENFRKGDTVLDPFAGSGTTLVESNVLGINSVGIDISFFNCLLMKVKTDKYDINLLKKEIMDILDKTKTFSIRLNSRNSLSKVEKLETDSEYLNDWFSPRSLQEILFYRCLIKNYKYRDVLKIILSRAARSARQIPHFDLGRAETPVKGSYYCHKHSRTCYPTEECLKFLIRYSYDTVKRIEEFSKIMTDSNVKIMNDDIRHVELDGEIDGVFTSPPYVGIIDYHDQHKYAYELFEMPSNEDKEIGAKSSGFNGKSKEFYKRDMINALINISKFIKPSGKIFVVANDRSNLYPEIAEKSNLIIHKKWERQVTRRTSMETSPYSETVFLMVKN